MIARHNKHVVVRRYRESDIHGIVEVVVDMDKLVLYLGGKALTNKSGKSKMLHGVIVATRHSYQEVPK